MTTTHIAVVLDRSGSMSYNNMMVEAAGAVNSFVDSLKDINGKKTVTINQFDYTFESTCSAVTPSKVPKLIAGENYNPRGTTALYDAVGKTITQLGNRKNVIVCIVTDGAENASREYTYKTVKKLIDEKTNKGWKFEFLSSDLKEVQDCGLSLFGAANTSGYADSQQGYATRSAVMTSSVKQYVDKINSSS